jgi:hypothetical protein
VLKLPDFLTELERSILLAFVEYEELFRKELVMQLEASSLKYRDNNGYGFFTHFNANDRVPSLPYASFHYHASAKIGGELCGFMLWITNGRIDFIEGYPLGGDALPQSGSVAEIQIS